MKRIYKTALVIALMMAMVLMMAGCGSKTEETSGSADTDTSGGAQQTEEAAEAAADPIGIHHAEIMIRDYGTIEVELDGDTAPVTVQNFMDLANAGFYDGLTFHRIIPGFMIQGGDPNGDGTGGSDHNIKGEFSSNGVENNISHKRGVISMARAQDPDSASSQFFIVHEDSEFLDGQYAAFGEVSLDSLVVVDDIAIKAEPVDDNGTILPENQPVIETVRIID